MPTWEYITTPLLIHNTTAILNNWGSEGWELVQVVTGPERGLVVPATSKPVAAYIPAVASGNLVYTSGQLPMVDGALPLTGKVGAEVSAEQAKELARTCVLNGLAAARSAI